MATPATNPRLSLQRHISWRDAFAGSVMLAVNSLRTNPGRAALAVLGIVIGIVTVSLVATVLVNVRNQIALLFRELGTENVFAFHDSAKHGITPALHVFTREI